MKIFLYKICLFVIGILSLMAISFGINRYSESKSGLDIKPWQDTLVLGDSTVYRGIDTETKLKRGINLAVAAELPSESYIKTKRVLENSENAHQIRYVVLGLGYQNISLAREIKKYGDASSLNNLCKKYAPMISEGYLSNFSNSLYHRILHCYLKNKILVNDYTINQFNNLSKEKEVLYGDGYRATMPLERTRDFYRTHAKRKSNNQFSFNGIDVSKYNGSINSESSLISSSQVNSIENLINYLKEKDIKTIITIMPVTGLYKNRIPQEIISEIKRIESGIKIKSKETIFLDYSEEFFETGERGFLNDSYHMSKKGARLIANKIRKVISEQDALLINQP